MASQQALTAVATCVRFPDPRPAVRIRHTVHAVDIVRLIMITLPPDIDVQEFVKPWETQCI